MADGCSQFLLPRRSDPQREPLAPDHKARVHRLYPDASQPASSRMMAKYRVNAAAAFLVKAFCPGDGAHLRCWSAKLERRGERVLVEYDVDGAYRQRAEKLCNSANAFRQVAIGTKAIRDISASIDGDVLTVSALLVRA